MELLGKDVHIVVVEDVEVSTPGFEGVEEGFKVEGMESEGEESEVWFDEEELRGGEGVYEDGEVESEAASEDDKEFAVFVVGFEVVIEEEILGIDEVVSGIEGIDACKAMT
jgi:hypothetical protein